MATKKVKDALASTTTPDQILAAAGVEVKLTKSELAEYVKELAIRELENQLQTAREARDNVGVDWGGMRLTFNNEEMPVRILRAVNALEGAGLKATKVSLNLSLDGKHSWYIEHDAHFSNISLPFQQEDYKIPANLDETIVLNKRIDDIRDKLHEIKNKNYKVLMIENALMSTDAGKMLVTNLQQMVKNLTTI